MFTGIIQHVGSVLSLEDHSAGRRLVIDASDWAHAAVGSLGESIAVDGCCVTIASIESERRRMVFDVIIQTLRVTTLGERKTGDRVNLEAAVTPATMLGGHIVQGHVDGVGSVGAVMRDASQHRLRIQPPSTEMMRLIVDKGSIAVNGVSLTVAAVDRDSFEVALIPTTVARTNLGDLRAGDRVNLECDYIAKIVANWLERRESSDAGASQRS